MDQITLNDASSTISAMIKRVEDTKTKFEPGTAQYTLQRNRLDALKVAFALVCKAQHEDTTPLQTSLDSLKRAVAPIASLLSKSEKARTKLDPISWQYGMLTENIKALMLVEPLLQQAIQTKKSEQV